MATLNSNDAHVAFTPEGGSEVVLSTYWADASFNFEGEEEDITTGAGADWRDYAPKLRSYTGSLSITMDDTNFDTYKALLYANNIGTLVYGPLGSTAGDPKFEGKIMFTSVEWEQSMEKNKLVYSISFRGKGAPTSTVEGDLAGTFPSS